MKAKLTKDLFLMWMETGAWVVKIAIAPIIIWALSKANAPMWFIWFMVFMCIGYIFDCIRLQEN